MYPYGKYLVMIFLMLVAIFSGLSFFAWFGVFVEKSKKEKPEDCSTMTHPPMVMMVLSLFIFLGSIFMMLYGQNQ